jgi:hypothetical protein
VGTIIVELQNGRRLAFDEVVVLDRENGRWLRCVRAEPSSRENLPKTTKYYHFASDVDQVHWRTATPD